MMTGDEYRQSLIDGRATYFDGERVDDLAGHPVLGKTLAYAAGNYDKRRGSNDPTPLTATPKDEDELQRIMSGLHDYGLLFLATYTSLQTIRTAAARIEGLDPAYRSRIENYVDYVRDNDLRVTQCITDAKGDRTKAPKDQTDKDAYLHVVERREDGVVIRGAKLHISLASFGHELLVMPTKSMKPGEEEYSIACAVPVNAPGVKIINISFSPRVDDDRSYPHSSKVHETVEGFVIFDDVFVPNERIFLNGEFKHAAVFAHSLGLWERLANLSHMAEEAEQLVGLAQLAAEANGIDRVGHVREKIAELITYSCIMKATASAAISESTWSDEGDVFPSELYTNVGKYYGAANYHSMIRHLHDIGGGSILTAPSPADFDNPEVGPFADKYMAGKDGFSGEKRAKVFHAIRDLTADTLGGWRMVTNIQAGGGLFAQRIVMRSHFDMEHAKGLAMNLIDGEG